jgi:hypothetical protein
MSSADLYARQPGIRKGRVGLLFFSHRICRPEEERKAPACRDAFRKAVWTAVRTMWLPYGLCVVASAGAGGCRCLDEGLRHRDRHTHHCCPFALPGEQYNPDESHFSLGDPIVAWSKAIPCRNRMLSHAEPCEEAFVSASSYHKEAQYSGPSGATSAVAETKMEVREDCLD